MTLQPPGRRDSFFYTENELAVSAILNPRPVTEGVPAEVVHDVLGSWLEGLEEEAQALGVAYDHRDEDEGDPLLATLARLRRSRARIEEDMTLLVAYMRERVRPRPYTLAQVSEASGLSISGTRTFYTEDDLREVDSRIAAARAALQPYQPQDDPAEDCDGDGGK